MKIIEKTDFANAHQMSKVAIASLILGLTNLVLLALLVVPRLYGMDPLGLGQWSSSSRFVEADNQSAGQHSDLKLANSSQQGLNSSLRTVVTPAIELTAAQAATDPYTERHEVVSLVVPPGQDLNYWLSMTRDCQLEYYWSTNGGALVVEFRGERPDSTPGEYKVFGKSTRNNAGGLFIAPFTGKFGWHWNNTSSNPVTVKLIANGEFQVPGKSG